MKALEILQEFSRSAPLFHIMQWKKAKNVFETDHMPGRFEHDIPGYGKVLGNSLTRNQNISWYGSTILQMNQTKLAQRFKIIPLNGEFVLAYKQTQDLKNTYKDRGSSELAEEFVVGDIKNLHIYVDKITIKYKHEFRFASKDEKLEIYHIPKAYAEKWNIPIIIAPEIIEFANPT
jgi:hypothetical protein